MHENEIEKEKYIPQHGPHFPSCVNIDAFVLIPLPRYYFESLKPQQPPIWSAGVVGVKKWGLSCWPLPHTQELQQRTDFFQIFATLGSRPQGWAENWFPEVPDSFFWRREVGCGGLLDPPCPASGLLHSNLWDPAPARKPPVSAPDPGQRRRLSVAPNHLSQELCC